MSDPMWIIFFLAWGMFLPTLIGAGVAELRKRRMLKRRFAPWDGTLPGDS